MGDPPLGGPGQFSKHPSAGHLSLHRPVKMSDGKTALLDDILEGACVVESSVSCHTRCANLCRLRSWMALVGLAVRPAPT